MALKIRKCYKYVAPLCTLFFGFSLVIQVVLAKYKFNDLNTSERRNLEISHFRQTPTIENDKNNDSISETTEGKFEFVQVPENATLYFGSSYAMFCKTTRSDAEIIWLKENITLREETLIPNLMLLENNTLWIKSMDYQLSGIYKCWAKIPTSTITTQAFILVRNDSSSNSSCSFNLSKFSKDSLFTEGEFAYLECLVKDPSIQLSWEKNNKVLRPTKDIAMVRRGYLFFKNIKREDAGIYSCICKDSTSNCTKKVSVLLQIASTPNIEESCGKAKAKEAIEDTNISRLEHGRNTKKGSHPWHVVLKHEIIANCSGVLLNNRWIVTVAAHLYLNKLNKEPWTDFKIVLGEYDRDIKEEEILTFIADVSSIIFHPHFSKEYYRNNNIALIRLRQSISFTDYILPICLADKTSGTILLNPNLYGEQRNYGVVTGFDYSMPSGIQRRVMQTINIPINDNYKCQKITRIIVHDGLICAGFAQSGAEDVCKGDGGVPLLKQHNDKWYLMGLLSFGEMCSLQDDYGYYTKVPNYFDWIKSIIKF